MNTSIKRLQLARISYKLKQCGIERTQAEIWERILGDAGYDERIAGAMLSNIENDDIIFSGFANAIEHREKVVVVTEHIRDEGLCVVFLLLGILLGVISCLLIGML